MLGFAVLLRCGRRQFEDATVSSTVLERIYPRLDHTESWLTWKLKAGPTPVCVACLLVSTAFTFSSHFQSLLTSCEALYTPPPSKTQATTQIKHHNHVQPLKLLHLYLVLLQLVDQLLQRPNHWRIPFYPIPHKPRRHNRTHHSAKYGRSYHRGNQIL
jgi:hypothetical protein